jgi:N-acetylmuramoyl-L-alanine amidase
VLAAGTLAVHWPRAEAAASTPAEPERVSMPRVVTSAPQPEPTPPAEPVAVEPAPEVPASPAARSAASARTPVARPSTTGARRRSRGPDRWTGPIPTPVDWRPPDGPVRIALQAGHWRADEAPAELSGLRENGTRWQDVAEWEVNLDIANRAAATLVEMGYLVDVLPAVVPPGYRAHLFISIHADGSGDSRAAGYRVAAPRRDATGRAAEVATLLDKSYGEATGLRRLGTVTRRMQNYYAFNFRRYEHALHPMTIGVILETGYMTNAGDRQVIVERPELAARGIVEAVLAYRETRLPAAAAGGR